MIGSKPPGRSAAATLRAIALVVLVATSAWVAAPAAGAGAGHDATGEAVRVAASAEHFVVTIESTNAPVLEGEPLNVTATVENTGETTGTQEVGLAIDGQSLREDSAHATVTLEPDQRTTITLSWSTGPGDAGNYTATVTSANDSASTEVSVRPSGALTTRIESTNSPVLEGETMTVTTTVENTGTDARSGSVTLTVGGTVRDSRELTLEAGETATVELTWETAPGDDGNYTATVVSPNDTDATSVTVQSTEADAVVTDGGTYWLGQVLATSAYDPGDEVELRAGDGTFISDVPVGDDGVVTLDTSRREGGSYRLTSQSGPTIAFDLVRQDYDVSASRLSVKNGGENTTVTLSVASNRDGYEHRLSSPQLSAEELRTILGGQGTVGPDGDVLTLSGTTEQTLTADFDGVDPGEYTINFDVGDTTASDNVTVTVVDAGAAEATFVSGREPVTAQRGDLEDIDVYLNATNVSTLTVGSEDLNYRVRMTVVDEDGDGRVTVRWNTHLAGQTADEGEAWRAAGTDRVTDVTRLTGTLSGRIAGEAYPMNLSVGGQETDVGTLSLQEPASVERSLSVSSAPGDLSMREVVNTLSKNITSFTTPDLGFANGSVAVADRDWALIRIHTAGVHGYIDNLADLRGDGTQGVSLSITETSLGPNEEASVVVLDSQNFSLVTDPGNDTLVVLVPTDAPGVETGETYAATFTIGRSNPYVDSTVEESASFTVVEPSITVDPPDGTVEAPNSSASRISGSSTMASGTALTVTVRSTGENVEDGAPFSRTTTVTVQNGTWAATFDFSEIPAGQEFTVRVEDEATGEVSTTRSGVVVVNAPPTVSVSSNAVRNNTVRFAADAADPDGSVAAYEWRVDGEVVSTERSFEHRFETAGDHRVSLTVTDDDGASATASVTVTIQGANDPPTATFRNNTVRNNTVAFRANASDPDGEVARYEWVIDGEVVSTEQSFEYTFESAGAHEVTLQVTDDDGATATASRTIRISASQLDAEDQPQGVGAPGFGAVATLLALLALGTGLARRRR